LLPTNEACRRAGDSTPTAALTGCVGSSAESNGRCSVAKATRNKGPMAKLERRVEKLAKRLKKVAKRHKKM
jgi:hypothetical protein